MIPKTQVSSRTIAIAQDLRQPGDTDFFTIGNNIATILANPDGIYKKRNESVDLLIMEDGQLKDIAAKLLKYFKEVAEPFCRKNASIARVDEILNSRPNESKLEAANDIYRMINGIVAAKLNNNPKLKELISIYERQMIEWNMDESHQEEFAKVKGLLLDAN